MFKTTICLLSIFCCVPALAQISSDGTLSTNVNTIDGKNFTIDKGNQLEGNLFHSFREFSIPNDGSAVFNNGADIINIFSRVTGGNPSNINGLLGANGNANLFLLNPSGIIFGENARLDIGGSFLGSTADSILFPDNVEFNTLASQARPILTIDAPIGLNFRDNPGDIVNQSVVNGEGLQVSPGKSITLVGGRVINKGGIITALDGEISLAGIEKAGTVGLDNTFNLDVPANIIRGDILINNGAFLNVRAEGRGSINLIGKNVEISAAEIITGVDEELGSQDIESGILYVDATDTVSINNDSFISTITLGPGNGGDIVINAEKKFNVDDSFIVTGAFIDPSDIVGKAGNIKIISNLVEINNESTLSTVSDGESNAGEVNIQANSLSLDDGSIVINSTLGAGNAGNINIDVNSLSLANGGELLSTTEGEGNAGNINVNASNVITLSGTAPVKEIDGFPGGFSSGLFSSSEIGATGRGGEINITTDKLQISDGAVLGARTKTSAPAGNIVVNANTLEITGGGQILTAAFAEGNAGNITLNIAEEIDISGSDSSFSDRREQVIELFNQLELELPDPEQTIDPINPVSGIFANTSSNSTGDAGIIDINADSISLTSGSISVSTNAGNQGNINLNVTKNLILINDSLISSKAFRGADGGNININSQFIIAFPSEAPNNGNDIVADALRGIGGNIEITAESLFGIQEREAVPNNGTNDIDASSDFGLDGNVSIVTPDINPLQTDRQLPNNPIKGEQTVAQACQTSNIAGKPSGLIVKGKGGIPPQPTEPFNSDLILVDGETNSTNLQAQHPEIKPIKTSQGDIYPARGIIKTVDGKIILTAYATDNLNTRTPHKSSNCISP